MVVTAQEAGFAWDREACLPLLSVKLRDALPPFGSLS